MPTADRLPRLDPAASPTGCCVLIDPDEWDERHFVFEDKPFAVVHTHDVLHVPLDMGHVMRRALKVIDDAGARAPDGLVLSRPVSPWRSLHYIAVTGPVPGWEVVLLSGRFLTEVFEGPYRDAGRWQQQLQRHARARGETPLQTFFFYSACPDCAKAFGANYVVDFEQVA